MGKKIRNKLGNLLGHADRTVAEMIRERGGNASNVRKAGPWAQKTLQETAEAAVNGDQSAGRAIKIVKVSSRRRRIMNVLDQSLVTTDPMLLPPRDEPYVLKDVLEKTVHGCRDEIVLDLSDCCLRVGVDINDDTLLFQFRARPFRPTKRWASLRSSEPWKKCIGKECGWTWLALNQQGYLDTMLISFDGIEPSIMLQGMASSIEVFTVARAKPKILVKAGRNGRHKADH